MSSLSSSCKARSFNSDCTSRILSKYSNPFNGPSEIIVNDSPYSVDLTDKFYILSSLMEDKASNILGAVQLDINSKMQDGSVKLLDTDENFTLVKNKKRKGKSYHEAADKKGANYNDNDIIVDSHTDGIATDDENSSENVIKKKPKPMMITEIPSIIEFLNEFSCNDKFKFEGKLAGEFIGPILNVFI